MSHRAQTILEAQAMHAGCGSRQVLPGVAAQIRLFGQAMSCARPHAVARYLGG